MQQDEELAVEPIYGPEIPLNVEFRVEDSAGFGFDATTAKFIRDKYHQLHVVAQGNGPNHPDDLRPGPLPGVSKLISSALPGPLYLFECHLETFNQTQNVRSAHHVEAQYLPGRIEGSWCDPTRCRRLVYWVINLPTNLLWPCVTTQLNEEKPIRGIPPTGYRANKMRSARDHVSLPIPLPGISAITLGIGSPNGVADKGTQFGYLELSISSDSQFDENIAHSLIRALEFAFGVELGVLGKSRYADDGALCAASLQSPRLIAGGPALQTFLLDNRSRNGLDTRLMREFLIRYLDYEARYELNRVSWLLSFSRLAPIDMMSVYAGVAFEILMNGFFAERGSGGRSTYFDRGDWEALHGRIREVSIDDPNVRNVLSEKEFKGFTGAIAHLNQRSIRSRSYEMLDILGIDYGDVEELALGSRNKAAHGRKLTEPQWHKAWLDRGRALEVLVVRVVLALLRLDLRYVDWTSEHHDVKPWRERQRIHDGPRSSWR